MPRIRYLKPDFFLDEDIANLPLAHRLTFAGLWCIADKAGRMQDAPKTIKCLIFPSDLSNINKELDINAILNDLAKKPFIKRYTVNNKKYIEIINFSKHQRPHHTEKESVIPDSNGVSTVSTPLKHRNRKVGMEKGMEKGMESLNKNVKCLFPFNHLWDRYPKRIGRQRALAKFTKSVKSQNDWADINIALDNYLKSDRVKRGFVQNGSTWFNQWQDWVKYKEEPKTEWKAP